MQEDTVRQVPHDAAQAVRDGEMLLSNDAPLQALPRVAPSIVQIIERRRGMPRMDLTSLRADLDEELDPSWAVFE